MEGGDEVSPGVQTTSYRHEFPITVTAYYMGNDLTATQLGTDLRTTRNYAYQYVDYYLTKSGGRTIGGGHIKKFKVDVGYWVSGGGQVVHYWIVKMDVTACSS